VSTPLIFSTVTYILLWLGQYIFEYLRSLIKKGKYGGTRRLSFRMKLKDLIEAFSWTKGNKRQLMDSFGLVSRRIKSCEIESPVVGE